MRPFRSCPPLLATLLLLAGCQEDPSAPDLTSIAFSATSIDLGTDWSGTVRVNNTGDRDVGPVELRAAPARLTGGAAVPGVELRTTPGSIATLAVGVDFDVGLRVEVSGALPLGDYTVELEAVAEGRTLGTVPVRFQVEPGDTVAIATLDLTSASGGPLLQGEVTALDLDARDLEGAAITDPPVEWSTIPEGAGLAAEARFVAYRTGQVSVVARIGRVADTLEFQVSPRERSASFSRLPGGDESGRHTSDLWLHGDYAYTGTWGSRETGTGTAFGNALFAWDISGAVPVRTDSIVVDARTVNDVKVRADGTLAVLTHEGSNDARNGVTLLDLSDPAHPVPLARYSAGLESGVHNAWIEGDHVYLVVDGVGSGLRVLDVSDPADPMTVGSFYAGQSFLHDVYVRDGIAFLSHWNAGLVLMDVGMGMAGGSPALPVELSRIRTAGGQTHNAWYWPEAGYVFVGEEDFGTPGIMHVIDVRDLLSPREVATFTLPDQPPHNFWLDEERGVLYLAWYGNGVRALDVTGELMGELDRQGRELAQLRYNGGDGSCSGTSTCTWAPQLHRGRLYLSDLNAGLVVLEPIF